MSEFNESEENEKPPRSKRATSFDNSSPPDESRPTCESKPVRRRAPRSTQSSGDKPKKKSPPRKAKAKSSAGSSRLARLVRYLWSRRRVRIATLVFVGILIVLALLAPTLLRWLGIGQRTAVAPLFTPEVQYWSASISRWAQEYGVDANLIATLMQIESCGYPGAASYAGAQGLFQVMPMHFDSSENMTDPETNARRGIGVIVECLRYTDNDVGLAMACYNGGPGLINRPPGEWPLESQHYYTWGSGIYNDAIRNASHSDTLDNWLAAGGVGLCERAAMALGLPGGQARNIPTAVPYTLPPDHLPTTIPPTPVPVLPTFAVVSPVQMPTLEGLPTYSPPTGAPVLGR